MFTTFDKMPNFAKIKTVNSPCAYFIGAGFSFIKVFN